MGRKEIGENMKERYQAPQMETTENTKEDIIITSGGTNQTTGSIKDLGTSIDKGGFGRLYYC